MCAVSAAQQYTLVEIVLKPNYVRSIQNCVKVCTLPVPQLYVLLSLDSRQKNLSSTRWLFSWILSLQAMDVSVSSLHAWLMNFLCLGHSVNCNSFVLGLLILYSSNVDFISPEDLTAQMKIIRCSDLPWGLIANSLHNFESSQASRLRMIAPCVSKCTRNIRLCSVSHCSKWVLSSWGCLETWVYSVSP